MKTVYYDIRDFKWDVDSKTFYADGWDLFDAEGDYTTALPSGKQQFVIKNYQSGNFRRFRFKKQGTDPFGTYYVFTSEEDEFRCVINLD